MFENDLLKINEYQDNIKDPTKPPGFLGLTYPFYKKNTCKKDPNAGWVGSEDNFAMLTSWSFITIIIAVVLTIIIVPILYLVPKAANSELFSSLFLILISGLALYSIVVGLSARILLSFNWKPLNPNKKDSVAIDEKWVKKLNRVHTIGHFIPFIISFLILVSIINAPWKGNKIILFLGSILVPIMLISIWLCVPVKVSPRINTKDKRTNPTNKWAYTYNFPNIWISISLLLILLLFGTIFTISKSNNTFTVNKK